MPELVGEVTHVELANVPLWLIVLLPFLGAAINALFGRWLQSRSWMDGLKKSLHIGSPAVSAVAVGVMVVSLVLTIVNVVQLYGLPGEHRYLYTHAWQMVRIGSFDVSFAFAMDPLSAVMAMVVTGVGTLIHIYATSYMETEPSYWRFFSYFNLFIFAMLLLVLGDNFIVMFFGWEGVGLCSYLLIGFWYKDYNKASAGTKAFIVNRVGDFGFICGMALLFWGLGGAWLPDSGDFMPDFRARFAAVQAEPVSLHGGGHGAEHGDSGDHGGGDHGAPAQGAGHGDGVGVGPSGSQALASQAASQLAQGPHHDHKHGPGAGRGRPVGMGNKPHTGPPLPKPVKRPAKGLQGVGASGLLTMTTHAGARVYIGISTLEQLKSVMEQERHDDALERAGTPVRRHHDDCAKREVWRAEKGTQLAPDCYAVSPFLRKRLPPGLHQIVIVPGDGAVVSGDGNEVAGFHVRIESGKETLLAPVGPTLTFREIHDQLVMRTRKPDMTVSFGGPAHGHELVISTQDIEAANKKKIGHTYTTGGNAVHHHKLKLSAAHFVALAGGKELTLATLPAGADGHVHQVTVRKQMLLKDALKHKTAWGISLITLACLLFFIGACGKSAQIPLYVWLPDAMAGPTPVSALIHAATMVTAGVYMVARLNFLFGLTPTTSGIVALVGATTALFAATIGFFQYDIKKVLAYSTVSQLGFMFIGVGVGAYWAAVFHLMTHAFFKACLFLASGSVIHGMHAVEHDADEAQDMRNMGGLRRVMPHTALTYKIACIAITAVPPGMAGFWSKDEILWKAFNTEYTGGIPGWLIYGMGLVAAIGTSFYMWRSYYLTFEGKHAKEAIEKDVHESPKPMTWVLMALAGLSVVAGIVFGISSHFTAGVGAGTLPHEPLLEQWFGPVMAHNEVVIGDAGYGWMYGLMALSVGGAIATWAIAKARYGAGRSESWAKIEQQLPAFEVLHNKYWVDEIYQATVIAGFMKLRLIFAEMDRWIVDGIVNGTGALARGSAWVSGAIDHYIVDGVVNLVAEGTLRAGSKLRVVQTGRVQNYIYGILGGVAALAIIQYFLS